MRRIFKKKRSLSVLSVLISGIAVLCAGFFITMCGSGPQTGIALVNRGAYAIDFSSATSTPDATVGFVDLAQSIGDMAGLTGFTIEAWVKRTYGALSGSIFTKSWDDGGGTSHGIALIAGAFGPAATNTPLFAQVNASTVYSVTLAASGTPFAVNQWTHVAGVFTNQLHNSDVHSTCRGSGVYASTTAYHLDLYVDGIFVNCAEAAALQAFSYNERIGRPLTIFPSTSITLPLESKLNAVIDEVRFWKTARTGDQIQACYSQEIGVGGTCGWSSDLIGYWRFNEGVGYKIDDSSGTGNNGTASYCITGSGCDGGGGNSGSSTSWTGGWTAGYPF